VEALDALRHALELAFSMTWEILWALILGFALSAAVQAVVRRSTIVGLLGDDGPRAILAATALGAASSSCSYAAVALARSLFRKGAGFTAAMAFEVASTNLVVELGIILAVLIDWRFTAGEFVGGPVMIIVLAVLFRALLRPSLVTAARRQADRAVAGSMEGHAAMDMSVGGEGSLARRLTSSRGVTAISHIYVMEWAAVLRDVVLGLLIAGAIDAWVPDSFWRSFFVAGHPLVARVWGPLVGPLVAVASFVCSIGNVPLAAVLWNGGISFGGVVSFIFADLLIIPILTIYRKYYGTRMAAFIAGTFYVAAVVAGYLVEILFALVGLTPTARHAKVEETHVAWNYTTVLNILFLVLAAALLVRFVRTGGPAMLRMMGGGPAEPTSPTSPAGPAGPDHGST
jgi:uncharacterized membrane protein YraQ (UPF0718 family)